MRNVIRLGDETSHGGKVISSRANHFKVGGIPVACVGDQCSCPMAGHNGCARTLTGALSLARCRSQARDEECPEISGYLSRRPARQRRGPEP